MRGHSESRDVLTMRMLTRMDDLSVEAGRRVRAWEDAILGSAFLFECVDGARPPPPQKGAKGGWRVAAAAIAGGTLVMMTSGAALPAMELVRRRTLLESPPDTPFARDHVFPNLCGFCTAIF